MMFFHLQNLVATRPGGTVPSERLPQGLGTAFWEEGELLRDVLEVVEQSVFASPYCHRVGGGVVPDIGSGWYISEVLNMLQDPKHEDTRAARRFRLGTCSYSVMFT